MSLRVTINMQQSGVETEEGEFVDPQNATTTVNGLNSTAELTGSTTPPVTKQSSGRATMTAGAATIDLTSLPDKNGTPGAVTFLGLKVQSYIFHNPGVNDIVVTFGDSNPYNLRGSGFVLTVRPGETDQWRGNDLAPDVASGAKILKVTGTGTQYLQYHMAAG